MIGWQQELGNATYAVFAGDNLIELQALRKTLQSLHPEFIFITPMEMTKVREDWQRKKRWVFYGWRLS